MLSNKNTKNANFLFIVDMLKDLLAQELITEKEYARAKKYYMKLTGADIVLAHWKLCICMEYDDSIVRQMVECIKAYPGGKLEIIFGGGYLVEESV